MRYKVLLLLALVTYSQLSFASGNLPKPEAVKGVLDLSKFNDISSIKLNGEWYFAWGIFQQNFYAQKNTTFVVLPEAWNNETSSMFTSGTGYCTYGLKVILPEQRSWMLNIPPIHSAYNLYVDGKLYAQSGKIGKDSRMFPSAIPKMVYFENHRDSVFITIQVSNFYFSSGGIWAPISIGTPVAISAQRERSLAISSFLMGSLLIMGLYHVGLYLLRTKDRGPLFFSIICFFIALRESFAGEALFYTIWPSIDYESSIKILYSVFPFSLGALVLYFENLYTGYSLTVKRSMIVICILYFTLILTTNNLIYGRCLIFVIIIFAGQFIYWLFLIFYGFRSARTLNILVLFGLIAVIISIFNDILFEAGIWNTFFSLPIGFFVFVLCQSILLSIRFSHAFRQTEILSVELGESELAYAQILLKQQRAEEMKAIEEMKNRFFSNITHEFKTPLSLIISPIEKLRQGFVDVLVLESSLNTIHRSARNLLNLINQLLDLSKLEAGSMQVNHYRGSPAQFLESVIAQFNFIALHKRIDLDIELLHLPVELAFDSEKLERIVSNLVSNALKFTSLGGSVLIKADFDNTYIRLIVKDNGVGIPLDKQPYIFDRFYQADSSSTREFGGSGIGLALVKELTTLVGGEIHFESDIRLGTTFQLLFPAILPSLDTDKLPLIVISPFEPVEFGQPLDNLNLSQNDQLSILLVEDNSELLEYIHNELSKIYRVLTASNGVKGWQICIEELPDLVISDVMMPEMDGFDLCKKIKETETTNHIGVILLTAKGSHENRILGLTLGANDYLPKPFSQHELMLRIANFLNYKIGIRNYYCKQLTELPEADLREDLDRDNPFLKRLYEYVDQSIDNSELSVGEVASALAVSERTLHRKLTSMVGLSTNEVIRAYRLKKSVELLRSGLNISEVAYRVGFDSPSYFGQCFKDAYNVPPSEFLSK